MDDRPALGCAAEASSGNVRHLTTSVSAMTLVDRTTTFDRLSSTSACCSPSWELAAIRHSTSPLPVIVCASMTPGIASRSRWTASMAPWAISRVTNAWMPKPAAATSTSGP